MNGKTYLISLIIITLLSGSLLARRTSQVFAGNLNGFTVMEEAVTQAVTDAFISPSKINSQESLVIQTPVAQSQPPFATPKPTTKPQTTPQTTPKIDSNSQTTVNTNDNTVSRDKLLNLGRIPQTCYRFTVPHLDGSSSSKCYSQSDYSQLNALYNSYSTAQANYNFEMSVKNMYEDAQKTAHDPGFFQPSIDEAAQKVKQYQDRVGQIALQLYTIESRGF